MVDATAADVLDVSDAWEVTVNGGPLNIYFIGEAGAGKSTLVRSLAEGIAEIPTFIGRAQDDTRVPLPSGLVLIDTPGFRIPVPPADPEPNATFLGRIATRIFNSYMHRRQVSRWLSLLSDLRLKFEAAQPSQQPAAAVVYAHKAGARIAVDRISQALAVPVQSNIPTFIALTDVHAVDESDLSEILESLESAASLVKPGTLRRPIKVLQINSVPKSVQGVEIEPSGLPELVTEMLNSLRPEDILRHTKRNQHEALNRVVLPLVGLAAWLWSGPLFAILVAWAWRKWASKRITLVLPLIGFAALIWSGYPLFAVVAGVAWRTWAVQSPNDRKAHQHVSSRGRKFVRRGNTIGADASARVEYPFSTMEEVRQPNERTDYLRDAEIGSQFQESVRRPDTREFSNTQGSTQDQIRALESLTRLESRGRLSLDRFERRGRWSRLFGGRRRQDYADDYAVQGSGLFDGYEAEDSPYQPMPSTNTRMGASLSATEETIAAARKDARRSMENAQYMTKGTAALDDGGRIFHDSSEEPSSLPVNKDIETPAAEVANSPEFAEMEARWSKIFNSQQETLQEMLGTSERLEVQLGEAKSRIEELEEDLLLCRCRLITEKPGAAGAIPADDRATNASYEADSDGVEPPPQLSE